MQHQPACPECGSPIVQAEAGSRQLTCTHCGAGLGFRDADDRIEAILVDEEQRGAYFPLKFFIDFLHYLSARPNKYKIITYDDFCWSEGERYPDHYSAEYRRWQRTLAADEDRDKICILIQHDVDSRPQRSMTVLRHEMECGMPSNPMIFSKRVDRKRLKYDGVVAETEYPVDHDLLASLERDHNFVVGYHSNAVERAAFDPARARAIFKADVADLRQRYRIRYFSPHGGVPAPDGRNNSSIEVPDELRDSLVWVHNKNSAVFKSTYSDGGINNRTRDPESRNLVDFLKQCRPGNRYRVLTHPQYYNSNYREAPVLMQSSWYREVLTHYEETPHISLWEKSLG